MRSIVDPATNETDWQLVDEVLGQFRKDTLYTDSHRREWTLDHPNYWAIVFNEELVSVAPSLEEAMAMAEIKGVTCNLATRELLSTGEYDLML